MDNNLKYCPVCGNENPVDAVFCGHCGYDFSTAGSDQYQNTQYRDNEYNQQGYNSYQQQDQYNNQQYTQEQYNNQYNQNQYYNQYGYNTYNKQPKNSNGAKIAIIIVSIVLAVAVAAAGIYFLVFYDKDGDKNSNNGSVSAASSAKPIATTMPASTPNATPTPSPSPSPTPTPLPAANGGYVLPESSMRVVTKSDLIGLTPEQLMIARNEIYARHGRQFKTEWLQTHFNACPWYIINPNYNYNNEDSMLSSLELQNAKFILDYENGKI